MALIIGEAGIGKSRLVQRFQEQIAGTPHTWVEAGAGAFYQNTPFYAVTEMLREFLAWRSDESAEEQLTRLEPSLELAGLKPAEALPLIAPLLNLPVPAKYPPLSLSPEQQRRRLLATLMDWVLGAARAQPMVIAIEDLHWADPSTLELLQLLVEQGATARLLLLYTARPEFHAQWPQRAHHTQITLNRLSSRNVRTMVGQVASQKALSEETIATVVERTGGVPLFVEELTRAMLESGNARLTGREIPVTLHDSLMARLDRLGPAKEAIQIGAVIGSEFSYELLHAVHPLAEEDLQRELCSLADAELLYVRGIAPEATYLFKHALIRDAAYEALLKSRRKELHRLVASTINEKFPALKETHPEVLARHWAEAGETELAIAEWVRAGNTAEARNAFSEALNNYQQALALLNSLSESPERDHRELELSQLALQMLFVTRGYSASETTGAIEHAAVLAEKTGSLKHLVGAALNRILAPLNSGNLPVAGILADQALELAMREGSSGAIGMAHAFQTCVRYQRGDCVGVEQHYRAWLRFVDDPLFRQVPGAAIWTFFAASYTAWIAGRPDIARQRMEQMTDFANKANPHDLVLSALCSADLMSLLRQYDQAETLAARALELAEKHQFSNEVVYSLCTLGTARVRLRPDADTIALIRQSIAGMLENGTPLGVSWTTATLAEAQGRVGAIGEALETVEHALQANRDQLVNRPDILRVRGELRLKAEQPELAEADFRDAVELAQKMSAKAWELRATMSLARLLDKQGRRVEARAMLAEIYGWFTEGFDTADLKDAKALLCELTE